MNESELWAKLRFLHSELNEKKMILLDLLQLQDRVFLN